MEVGERNYGLNGDEEGEEVLSLLRKSKDHKDIEKIGVASAAGIEDFLKDQEGGNGLMDDEFKEFSNEDEGASFEAKNVEFWIENPPLVTEIQGTVESAIATQDGGPQKLPGYHDFSIANESGHVNGLHSYEGFRHGISGNEDAIESYSTTGDLTPSRTTGVEMDLKRVLAEQETYDLFCPNCKSCITRRVILRKRKRTSQVTPDHAKRGKEDLPRDNADTVVIHESITTPEPEVFGCLQCLSIFIRTASGYELLSKRFRIRTEDAHVQNSGGEEGETVVAVQDDKNLYCLTFLFGWGKEATPSNVPETVVIERAEPDSQTSPTYENSVENSQGTGIVAAPEAVVVTEQVSIVTHSPMLADLAGTAKPVPSSHELKVEIISSSGGKDLLVHLEDHNAPASNVPMHEETRIQITETTTASTVDESSTMQAQSAPYEWDILKSIVYGGLAESITSLGVVSSAAGGDASTLNVIALGLANLIGGLFVIAHNVADMKADSAKYREAIGRPECFWRNSAVVLISYIIFGAVAPVTYGFSFRSSDDKEYKLIAVAAASLLCIVLLAVGKARVSGSSYMKTILYYVGLGFAASGISYVVGVLVRVILEKLGLFTDSLKANSSLSILLNTGGSILSTSVS